MYRVSPFTYLVDGMISTGVANQEVHCADNEYLTFSPPSGQTCGAYMQPYIAQAGGYLQDSDALQNCKFCTYDSTNIFLAGISANYKDAWRNYGILWVFIIFNVAGAVTIYWLARVPKKAKREKEKTQ